MRSATQPETFRSSLRSATVLRLLRLFFQPGLVDGHARRKIGRSQYLRATIPVGLIIGCVLCSNFLGFARQQDRPDQRNRRQDYRRYEMSLQYRLSLLVCAALRAAGIFGSYRVTKG